MDMFYLEPVGLLGSYHLPGGRRLYLGGTRIIRVVKVGGGAFFRRAKGGTRIFLLMQKGGDQKKLSTGHHKETVTFLVKNDSSLWSLNYTDV